MSKGEWNPTGEVYLVSNPWEVDNVPAYDPIAREHLWTIGTIYRVHPDLMRHRRETPVLGPQNLLAVAGPGCFYCEREWSPKLDVEPCPGEP